MFRKNILILLLALLAVDTFALPALGQGKINIVTTTGMISDLVANVSKDKAEVSNIIGSGVDPHLYKPTRTDISKLSTAELVFYNGLMLEGKMTDALIRVATSGKKVVPVTELVDNSELLEPSAFAGLYDPHVWMDPKTWSKTVAVVKTKLSEFDQKNAGYYAANADEYFKKIMALDAYVTKCVQSIPKESRILVTAHDAFNYFGKSYGVEVIGIQGLSTESEAGVKDIEKIVQTLIEKKISAVFVESTVSARNVQALIEGAEARGHKVKIGGELFSDAMGLTGTYEGTYIGMIDHNVTQITRALGGAADAKGMSGLLKTKAE